MVGDPGARIGEQKRRGRTQGELNSKKECSAVNHRHCLAPIWKEKKMRSVGFTWGYTYCITLGYQMDLKAKCLLEQALMDKVW